MGLFKKRKKQSAEPADVVEQVFDAQYRDELRKLGKDHFKHLIETKTGDLRGDIDVILEQLTGTLRRHMASQLDLAITRVNNEISNQLKEQMNEFNRVSRESQDLVVQSLSRNAQSVHEKYQQMSSGLQQVVASQEVMMVGVFQENKNRVSAVQAEQEKALETINQSAQRVSQRADQLSSDLEKNVTDQASHLANIYQQNLARLEESREAQNKALESLASSNEELKRQHQELRQLVDTSIANQKAMLTDLINDNMARIVEHYVVGALGEQSDLSEQLPAILQRMEENKQAMSDDMRL